jgi:branched-chain amino acid transport system permease protein
VAVRPFARYRRPVSQIPCLSGVPRFLAALRRAWWLIALTALPVIILGGLDSLVGAVIAGLAIGVVQALAASYPAWVSFLGSNASLIVPWLVMMLVLVVRPYGLFGTREVERV